MDRQEEVKINVFSVIEEQWPLEAFEAWLYDQNDLADQMNDSLILELFAFNYRQEGAHYVFRDVMLRYSNRKEFLLWKVKANLQDLIDGKGSRDRILQDFLTLSYNDIPILTKLGYYAYHFEDLEFAGQLKDSMIQEIKAEATALLSVINAQHAKNPHFDICDFERNNNELQVLGYTSPLPGRKWWQF
ncbi:MAG: hypothetical protein HYZ44_17065 [Bacteroidetes bacterium]|nr:hypothetical protein [Bacteroidota bacterium]